MEKVGTIYVDAGVVMVGDPCYTQGADASSAVSSWDEFLSRTWPNVFGDGSINREEQMADVANALGQQGTGIVVESGYGDGEYPVYVTRADDGRIASLTVVFIGDEVDSGWDDEDEDEFGDLEVDEDDLYGPDPEDDETGN